MDNTVLGLVLLGGLLVLCVVLVIIGLLHAVWLIKLLYSVLTNKPIAARPFTKSNTE